MRVTITGHAAGSAVMKRFVRNLKESSLFAGLDQGGMSSIELSGVTLKQKTIDLYVLDAECIAP